MTRSFLRDGSAAAVLTWLAGTPVAILAARAQGLSPVSARGASLPLAMGAAGAAAVALALYAWRRTGFAGAGSGARRAAVLDSVVGVLAGGYAAWVAFTAKAALTGTPYGFGGVSGDAKRIVAAAVRYTTTWRSADTFTPGLPSEYPPLYAWLVGRTSAATGVPAWHLIAGAQVLGLSIAVLAAFLLWRRLVPAPVALIIAALTFVGQADPSKPYEIVALAALLPWVLLTFADPPAGRLHPVIAGIVGGLMLLTYQGYLVFVSPAVLVLAWRSWRSDRRYLRHLAAVAVTAVVVAAGYLVPYAWAVATRPTHLAADTYQSPAYAAGFPLPFLNPTPAGLAQFAGLIGLVCLLGRAWWARPVLTVLAGTYAFVVLGWLRWALTGHNMFVHYAVRVVATILIASAVLTGWEVVRHLAERPYASTVRRLAALAAVSIVAAQAVVQWRVWYPTMGTAESPVRVATLQGGTMADAAHREPLPDGRLPRWAPLGGRVNWLDVARIRNEVARRLGADARPTLLTVDERVFAFVPWYQYLPKVAATAPTLAQYGAREAVVRSLAAQTDAAEFAARAADTPFGPINAFLLNSSPQGTLWWRDVSFRAAQFDPLRFDRVDLGNGFVLFVARPHRVDQATPR